MHSRLVVQACLFAVFSYFVEGVFANQNLVQRQSPLLFFDDPPIATLCSPVTFEWIYAGPDLSLVFAITNDEVDQTLQPTSTSSTSSTSPTRSSPPLTDARGPRAIPTGLIMPTSAIIGTGIDSFSNSYTWPVVNLIAGNYNLTAFASTGLLDSKLLFIRGNNNSCLTTSISTSSSSPSNTNTLTSTSTSPSTTSSGVAVASNTTSLHTGSIIGIVFGIAAFIIIIIIIYLFFIRRRDPNAHSAGAGAGGSFSRKWNGLGSVDSTSHSKKRAYMTSNMKAQRHSSHADSLGPINGMASEEAIGNYPSEEKFTPTSISPVSHGVNASSPFDDPGDLALPVQSSRRSIPRSSHAFSSSSTSVVDAYDKRISNGGPISVAIPGARTSLAESPTYPPSPAYLSGTSGVAYVQHSSSHSPRTPSETSPPFDNQANRSSIGLASTRKTARKPVPTYDPASLPASVSPSPAFNGTTAVDQTPPESLFEQERYTPGIAQGHYSTRKQSQPDLTTPPLQELAHKNSFGPGGVEGKPLHFLIPDMPLSTKD